MTSMIRAAALAVLALITRETTAAPHRSSRSTAAATLAEASAVPRPAEVGSADAIVIAYRIDANGRRAGLIFDGGATLGLLPESAARLLDELAPSSRVGLRQEPHGLVVRNEATGLALDFGDVTLRDVRTLEGRGIGGGPPVARHPEPVFGLVELRPLTFEEPIRHVLRSLDGEPIGLLLDGGAQVWLLPEVARVLEGLSERERVRVHGLGTPGRPSAAWAVVIERPRPSAVPEIVLDLRRGGGTPALGISPCGDERAAPPGRP